jgi:hypothetical protein
MSSMGLPSPPSPFWLVPSKEAQSLPTHPLHSYFSIFLLSGLHYFFFYLLSLLTVEKSERDFIISEMALFEGIGHRLSVGQFKCQQCICARIGHSRRSPLLIFSCLKADSDRAIIDSFLPFSFTKKSNTQT